MKEKEKLFDNECFDTAMTAAEIIEPSDNGITGLLTGFKGLDKITGGFQKREVIVVEGDSSEEMLAFGLQVIYYVTIKETVPTVILFSGLKNEELVYHNIYMETEIDSNKMKTGCLEEQEWQKVISCMETLSKAPIYFDNGNAAALEDVLKKCKPLKDEKGLGLIVIGDLNQMCKACHRDEDRTKVILELKKIASELDVPIMVFYQTECVPYAPEFKEIDDVESKADTVVYLHRMENEGNMRRLGVMKQKKGGPVKLDVLWNEKYKKFEE